jgi:hypothetical protein
MRLLDQRLRLAAGDAGQRDVEGGLKAEAPSERSPNPTVTITSASSGTVGPPCEANNCMELRKQAA